ncbi:MAG: hypothetical protein AVDCRST_MAG13-3240, partial [uncultured Solirubrobacteraceae bacterium]
GLPRRPAARPGLRGPRDDRGGHQPLRDAAHLRGDHARRPARPPGARAAVGPGRGARRRRHAASRHPPRGGLVAHRGARRGLPRERPHGAASRALPAAAPRRAARAPAAAARHGRARVAGRAPASV